MFPRSWGGLKGVERQLPRLAELGFDVVYLPPIHPIGLTNRKGANNSLIAGRIATPAHRGRSATPRGGHDAVHAELGTIEDLRTLTGRRSAQDRHRARLRDPMLGRPPVADRAP